MKTLAWIVTMLALALAPRVAHAWSLAIEDCDGATRADLALEARLALEVPSDTDDTPAILIRGPCGETLETHVIVTASALRLEQTVALDAIPARIRTRTLALLAASMVASMRVLASSVTTTDDVRDVAVPARPPVPLPEAPVAPVPAPIEPLRATPHFAIAAAASGRIYVGEVLTLLAGARLALALDWLDVELGVEGTQTSRALVGADAVLTLASIGVRPVVVRGGDLSFTLGAHAEIGALTTLAHANVDGLVGQTASNVVAGGFVRAATSVVVDRLASLRITVDVGAHGGPALELGSERVLQAAGLFAALGVGVLVPDP